MLGHIKEVNTMENIKFVTLNNNELEEVNGGAVLSWLIPAVITGTIMLGTYGYSQVQDYYYRKGYIEGYNSVAK